MGLEIIAIAAISAISTGLSVYGQRQQAKSQEYAAQYNAKVAENEARNAELEGAEQQKRMRQQNRRKMAGLRNNLAANGTLTTTGTSLDLLGENAANLDLAIRDADRETQVAAASFRSKAGMSLWEGQQYRRAGTIGAWTEGVKGVSSFYQNVKAYG